MASSIITPVAQTLATFIGSLVLADGTTVKGYTYDPGTAGIDRIPAGIVGLPSIRRTDPRDAEPQLGSEEWAFDLPVSLVVDLSEAVFAQAQAVELVELFIDAVDDNPSLGDPTIVADSVVVDSEPVEVLDDRRPLLMFECRVLVEKLVSRP